MEDNRKRAGVYTFCGMCAVVSWSRGIWHYRILHTWFFISKDKQLSSTCGTHTLLDKNMVIFQYHKNLRGEGKLEFWLTFSERNKKYWRVKYVDHFPICLVSVKKLTWIHPRCYLKSFTTASASFIAWFCLLIHYEPFPWHPPISAGTRGRKEGGTSEKICKDKIKGKVTRNEIFCLKVDIVGGDRHGNNPWSFIPLLRFWLKSLLSFDQRFDKMCGLDKRLLLVLSYWTNALG